MTIPYIAFFLFSAVALFSGLMVITVKNPVHAVLFLILTFFNAAALFLLAGAEFLAMILVIVYVGAVAVLFLFVVMMLDINFAELRQGFMKYLPVGGLVGFVLLAELVFAAQAWSSAGFADAVRRAPISDMEVSNTKALGDILYTQYFIVFQMAGLILLVAMIGAIVLTHRKREGVRRQSIREQVQRTREDAVTIAKVEIGAGITPGTGV